jgi:hypothetical protein
MRARQSRVLETPRRVQGFLDRNDEVLGTINQSGFRRKLDDIVARLSTHAVDQDAGRVNSEGETARNRVLRVDLRVRYMRPIASIARAELGQTPEFRALTLPDPRASTNRLLAAAGAMADAAAMHAEIFIDGGLPADFAARLLAAADAVKQSIDARAQSRGRRVGATAGLAAEEKKGRNAVRVLDSFVVPQLGTNDTLLAEWRILRRIHARTGPGRQPEPVAVSQ